ncbi:uncharacterized protein [Hetaerina americana]|uniref:uncharacterized protein n=1 Tax=Hetaerina americana TaxID=62018 RepID=UPI003A7F16F2
MSGVEGTAGARERTKTLLTETKGKFENSANDLNQLLAHEKMTKEKKGEMMGCFSKLTSCFHEILAELNAQVAANEILVDSSTKTIDLIKNTIAEEFQKMSNIPKAPTPLFTDIVASQKAQKKATQVNLPGAKPIPTSNSFSVLIYPGNDDLETSDQTKDLIIEKVNPSKIGLKIKRIKRVANKGVCIESDSNLIEEKLKTCDVFQKGQLIIKKPEKRNPRIAVYSVKNDITEEQLQDCLKNQNDLTEPALVKPLFRFGKRNEHVTNWVVELDPESRKVLMTFGKVFIGFNSCKISDHIHITRCFKCQGFGHLAKDCKNEKDCCSHCAGEHKFEDCAKEKENICCSNCKKANVQDSKHSAGDWKCPIYCKLRDSIVSSTNYG